MIESRIESWQKQCMQAAATLVYESSVEIGRQIGVKLPPEPFSAKQQKKCRFDGGINADGTKGHHLPLQPAIQDKHVLHEIEIAEKEMRPPKASYDVPLTHSSHSSMPTYRLLQSFGADTFRDAKLRPPHALPFDEKTQSFLNFDGNQSTMTEIKEDAKRWQQAFAKDAFTMHVLNHDHACTKTCNRNKGQSKAKKTKEKTTQKNNQLKNLAPADLVLTM